MILWDSLLRRKLQIIALGFTSSKSQVKNSFGVSPCKAFVRIVEVRRCWPEHRVLKKKKNSSVLFVMSNNLSVKLFALTNFNSLRIF